MSRLHRFRRQLAFARHIPPRQILARLRLEVSRRLAQRRRPHLLAGLPLAATPPQPVFALRAGMITHREDGGWRFTFLHQARNYAATIDWNDPAPATATQLWRMNLHYMEYLEELDPAAALALMRQWIAGNPPYTPGFWRDAWNSYTVSLRTIVWMQQLARYAIFPADIVASLAAQLDFLARNLELDLGGNHLVKNIKALAWGAAFFAGPAAQRWRATAIRLLRRELPRQVLADGVHYERSPSYHCQVLADLIETRHALGHDPLGGALDDALARMTRAALLLTHPDGLVAQFNDAGLSMAYRADACAAALETVTGTAVTVDEGAFALPDAGYFGRRVGNDYLIVDMGAIGPDDLPAHAHGDVGSIELSVAGERIVVDPGVYEYVAGPLRAASRSAASHNVLALDGADQADFYGAFRCGRRPRVSVERCDIDGDCLALAGSHDGYATLLGAPRVRREITAGAGRITITDRITGGRAAGRLGFLLHPHCAVTLDGGRATITRGAAYLILTADRPFALEAAPWWPDMGQSLQAPRLHLTLAPGSRESRVDAQFRSLGTITAA